MSEAKISKLEKQIAEITARPTYASTPAWKQEVAELRLQIEGLRSGKDVERKEYQPAVLATAAAAAPAAATGVIGEDVDDHDHDHDDPNYAMIFFGLALLTLLEWKAAQWFGIGGMTLWVSLSVMAVVKALMVAFWFMHLSFERKSFNFLLILPIILVMVLVGLLFPDAYQHVWDYIYLKVG